MPIGTKAAVTPSKPARPTISGRTTLRLSVAAALALMLALTFILPLIAGTSEADDAWMQAQAEMSR